MSICKFRLHYTFCVNFTADVIKGVPIVIFVIRIFDMKFIVTLCASLMLCACNSGDQFTCPSKLEDVESFYMEREPLIIHVNPQCGRNSVYFKEDMRGFGGEFLCSKCISPELAQDIWNKQYQY